jgi:UDP-glucose 4-epimerase
MDAARPQRRQRPAHVILRYFNVAGCDPEGRIGQSTAKATLLIKVAAETAVGRREADLRLRHRLPDAGRHGVRDYIHVEDLADAHIKALDYLRTGGESRILNCGYGHGFSVKARTVLDWTPRFDDLDQIVKTSLEWERKLAKGDVYG